MNSSDNKVRNKINEVFENTNWFFSIGSSIFLFKGDNEISSLIKSV